ncbi:MAG: MerR family transcriptional regulator [Eubacteriales bacterium]
MEYTVNKLAKLAGVSCRTLRYYDQIGLLSPSRVSSSGYRIYGGEQVDRLQQILFFRALGVELDKIRELISSPDYDSVSTLREHKEKLMNERRRLDLLIQNIERTIATSEGRSTMSDKEKFEGFKEKLVEENERKYGVEIRTKYGKEAVEKSNKKLLNMTKEQMDEAESINTRLFAKLSEAIGTGDPSCKAAQEAAELHRKWLSFYWDSYTPEAHAGIVRMYVEDERFAAYYDKQQAGTARFLRDAVLIYTGQNAD